MTEALSEDLTEKKRPIVCFITDFGSEDGYVGVMKGQVLKHAPEASIIDITHHIQPFNIHNAGFCLLTSVAHFPKGTCFVVVVDPGVGTERGCLLAKTDNFSVILPDNGILSFLNPYYDFDIYKINLDELPWEVSSTFHGRDVFSPMAGMVASEQDVSSFITTHQDIVLAKNSELKQTERGYDLEVIHVDHFGNLILNFKKEQWKDAHDEKSFQLVCDHILIPKLHDTFGQVKVGSLLSVWESNGFLQVSKNQGSAAEELSMSYGDRVQLVFN